MAKKQHYSDSPSDKQLKAFKKYLAEDEELIVATGFGSTYLRSLFIIAILWPGMIFFFLIIGFGFYLGYEGVQMLWIILLSLVAACLVAYLRTIHIHHAHRYLLTTRRVIVKKGIFSVRVSSAHYDKVTHIEVDQSFMDKILMHHGTIIVHTAGSSKDEMELKYVDSPIELKNILERLINRERQLMGGRDAGPVVTLEGEVV